MGRENRNMGRGNMRDTLRGICVKIAWNLRGYVAHTDVYKHNEQTLRFFHAFSRKFHGRVRRIFHGQILLRFHGQIRRL